MKKEVVSTGRSVEEALNNGCAELGVRRGVDDYEHEILDMPSKGFLGLGNKPARVRVWIETPDERPAPVRAPAAPKPAFSPAPPAQRPEAPAQKPAPAQRPAAPAPKPAEAAPAAEEKPAEPERPVDFGNKPQIVGEYVNGILSQMALDGVTATVTTEGQNIRVQINNDEAGVTIGRRGETLDALQYLTGLAANRGDGDFARVVIDSGSYRDKRRRTLEQLARKLAMNAVRTGRSTTLEPMNPYERRIIHAAVTQIEGAASASVGEEPNRCVVISSTNPRPQRDDERPRGDRPYNNRGPRRDDRPRGDRPPYGNRGGRDGRGGRDDRGRRPRPEPYHESGTREVAPSEAENHTLYGKVEI